jgi:hypothetical protein
MHFPSHNKGLHITKYKSSREFCLLDVTQETTTCCHFIVDSPRIISGLFSNEGVSHLPLSIPRGPAIIDVNGANEKHQSRANISRRLRGKTSRVNPAFSEWDSRPASDEAGRPLFPNFNVQIGTFISDRTANLLIQDLDAVEMCNPRYAKVKGRFIDEDFQPLACKDHSKL